MVADITFSTEDGELPLQADIRNAAPDYTFASFESVQAACELALEILLRHEWYHHQTELLATYLEDVAGEMLYRDYVGGSVSTGASRKDCLEESLANAYVARSRACMRRAPSTPAFHTLFEYSTRFQPDAYRAYERFTGQDFRSVAGISRIFFTLQTLLMLQHLSVIGASKRFSVLDYPSIRRLIGRRALAASQCTWFSLHRQHRT